MFARLFLAGAVLLRLASAACAQTTIPAGAYTDLGAGPVQIVNLTVGTQVSVCLASTQPPAGQVCQAVVGGAAPTPFASSLHLWAAPMQPFPASVLVSAIQGGSGGGTGSNVTSNDGGSAITGATIPAGGSGLTGWMSAIWTRLGSLLSVKINDGTTTAVVDPTTGGLKVWLMGGPSGVINNNGPAIPGNSSPVTPSNIGVGAASIATNQASVGTSATLIVAARTGVAGTGRVSVTIYNNGSSMVYLGGPGVTTSTGIHLAPGAAASSNTTAAFYGVAAVASQQVGVLETY